MKKSTAIKTEVDKFSALADAWWDPEGDFRPLHLINPERIRYIQKHISTHFKLSPRPTKPLQGLSLLDVGCGGGLLSEPLARLGLSVNGIDASDQNIEVATQHADESKLTINYRVGTPEKLTSKMDKFDVVLALEVLEHVQNMDHFIDATSALVKPGGLIFFSTLNRTIQSFLLAKIGAEYILRWLPKGTHQWSKFVRPSEVAAAMKKCCMEILDIKGLVYSPIKDTWIIRRDTSVNYFVVGRKPDD